MTFAVDCWALKVKALLIIYFHLNALAGSESRPHLCFPAAKWEGVQALVEMCCGAPRLFPPQGTGAGSQCTTELLQDGLSLPIQVRLNWQSAAAHAIWCHVKFVLPAQVIVCTHTGWHFMTSQQTKQLLQCFYWCVILCKELSFQFFNKNKTWKSGRIRFRMIY